MAKQLNVNLGFTADTSQAKAQIQDLQNKLTQLTTMSASSGKGLGLEKEIREASKAAAELKVHLANATNQKTGALDFTKLNQSIQKSGTSLDAYANKLRACGSVGQQAFTALTTSVANSEIKIKRSNALLQEMATTLKNTARWQLSSSMLHGFMSSLQSAYGYAKDLDKSLNNIRIVSGLSADEMSKFAERANKAAQALSTTTTKYTDAALIYYQQGLAEQDVQKRTDATIKMANVTGEAVQDVSSYMTAIWNNFNKEGQYAEEHFADIMTKLGAETAASTDEIAAGLSKFSAVADTIELSFEMASSAVTAIVDQTRESPEVVGTALKTIFSRVEGLSLGETLEDGTDLNKYSKGLAKVGVDIKDATGELKDMDTILHEIGDVWETLNKDQQVALAQTVAGVRQYNQFMALFDNWGHVEENLERAANAGGTLEEQSKIYEESWQAAANRVRASLENIWGQLLDDDAFKFILNGLDDIIDMVAAVTKGMGGLGGVIGAIGVIATKVFKDQMAAGLQNMAHNIKMSTQMGREAEKKKKEEFLQKQANAIPQTSNYTSPSEKARVENLRTQLELQNQMVEASERLSESEMEIVKIMMDGRNAIAKQYEEKAKVVEQSQKDLDAISMKMNTDIYANAHNGEADPEKANTIAQDSIEIATKGKDLIKDASEVEYYVNQLKALQQEKDIQLTLDTDEARKRVEAIDTEIEELKNDIHQVKNFDLEVKDDLANIEELEQKIADLKGQGKAKLQGIGLDNKDIDNYVKSASNKVVADKEMAKSQEDLKKVNDDVRASMEGAQKVDPPGWSEGIVAAGQAMSATLSIVTAFKSAMDTIMNPDASGWEKFVAVLTSVTTMLTMGSMAFSGLATVLKTVTTAKNWDTAATTLNSIATWINSKAKKDQAAASKEAEIAEEAETAATKKDTAANISNSATEKLKGKTVKKGPSVKGASFNGTPKKLGGGDDLAKGMKSAAGSAKNFASALGNLAKAAAPMAMAIAGIVAGLMTFSAIYNKTAKEAQEAAERAQEATKHFNEVQGAYDSFSSNLENYDSAKNGLEELTKGTVAYREGILKANEEALKLIDSYEGLKYTVGEDGLILIDETSLEEAEASQLEILENAQRAKIAADQQAQAAQLAADKEKFNRETLTNDGINFADSRENGAGIAGGALAGAGVGAAIGSVVPVIGTAVGAAVGTAVGAIGGLIATEFGEESTADEERAVDILAKAYEKDGASALTDENMQKILEAEGINQGVIDALIENKSATQELIQSINANNEATQAQNQMMAEQIMADENFNSESDQEAMQRGGEIYDQLQKDAYDKYMKTDMADLGVGTQEGKDLFADYASSIGLDQKDGFKVTDYKKDKVEYEYIDENGEKQTGVATKEMIAATLASADAADNLVEALENLSNKIEKLSESDDKGDNAMAKFLSDGNLEGTTQAEFKDIKTDVGYEKDKNGNVSYDEDKVDEKLGLTGDADADLEVAKAAGYESAEAYREAFLESLDVEFKLPPGVSEEMGAQMSLGAANAFTDTMDTLGEEGGEAFNNTLKMVSDGADWEALTPEEQTAVWNELANIDWSSWEAGDQAAEVMRKYNLEVDVNSEAWKNNIQVMRDASDALPDMTQLRENMEAINGIVDDIDLGSILSKEDYETLVAYNAELEKYFTQLGDGSVQFTGDKLDFEQEIEESHKNKLKESNKAYVEQLREDQAKFNDGSIYDLDELQGYATKGNEGEGSVGNRGGAGDDGKYSAATNEKLDNQLAFLETQGYDSKQLEEWSKLKEDGLLNPEDIREIGDAVKDTTTDYEGLEEQIRQNQEIAQGGMNELALMADDADERAQMVENGEINQQAADYAAMAAHNEEKWEGMDTTEVEDYADSLMDAAENSDLLSESLKDNEEAAEDVALYTKKMNKGVETLSENYDEWSDVLKNSDEASEEYSEAMGGMKEAMSDVLGVSEDFISNDFILEHMEDIEKAADGDAEAIDRLAIAAAKDILVNLELKDEGVRDEVYALHDQLAAEVPSIKVGTELETGKFLENAQELVDTAGMTVDEAQAYFNSLGYEPEFEMTEETVTRKVPQERTHTDYAIAPGTIEVLGQEFPIPTIDRITTTTVTGYKDMEEVIQVPALGANGAPKIKSLTKKSSGAMNNKSSSNSGGGKKGGGGGGGSKSKKKDKKKVKDEVERYHEIRNTIEDLNKELDKLGKAKDRAWGKDKLKLIEDEISATEDAIDAQEEYLRQIENNLGKDKTAAAKIGAKFDEQGNISNYEELRADLVKKFNASGRTDKDEEAYQNAVDILDQYEETHDLWMDEEQTLVDLKNNLYDKRLELVTVEVDAFTQVLDNVKNLYDYLLDKLEDKAFSAAERLEVVQKELGRIQEQNTVDKNGIQGILGNHVEEGEITQQQVNAYMRGDQSGIDAVSKLHLTEAEISQLEEYHQRLLDNAAAAADYWKQQHEIIRDGIDEYLEGFDKIDEKIQNQADTVTWYGDIIDLVGQKALGVNEELMKKMDKASLVASEAALQNSKNTLDAIQSAKLDAEAQLKAAQASGNETAIAEWEKTLEKLSEDEANAIADIHDTAMAHMENSARVFENTIARATAAASAKVAGQAGTIENLMDSMEKQQELDELYLKDYEQIYELSKLNRDISKSIDESDNIKAKQELKKLTQEINDIEASGNKISEYELEHLRKKYELKLAELALEEAQDAKSQVRMQRDSEGNWGYVYTADESSVEDAEQNYEDKLFALQEHTNEAINEIQQMWVDTQQALYEDLANLKVEDFANTEEYFAKVEEIKAYHMEKLGFCNEQLALGIEHNKELYENDWSEYAAANDYKIVAEENWLMDFEDTMLSTETGFTNFKDLQTASNEAIDGLLTESKEAYEYYRDEVEDALDIMGSNWEDFAEDMDTAINDEIIPAIQDAEEESQTLKEQMEDDIEDIMDAVGNWEKDYADTVDKMIENNEKLAESFQKVMAEWAGYKTEVNNQNNDDDDDKDNDNDGDDDKTDGKTLKTGGRFKVKSSTKIYDYAGDTSGEHQYFSYDPKYKIIGTKTINGKKWLKARWHKLSKGTSGWFKASEATAYDTGGYTGDWGTQEGKVAILHQKEMVLNAQDTENFLAAVEIVRDIANKIDLNAASAMSGGMAMASGQISEHSQTLQQHVEISASFPNATDHSEIEEAFKNLVNLASQHANRKR